MPDSNYLQEIVSKSLNIEVLAKHFSDIKTTWIPIIGSCFFALIVGYFLVNF